MPTVINKHERTETVTHDGQIHNMKVTTVYFSDGSIKEEFSRPSADRPRVTVRIKGPDRQ